MLSRRAAASSDFALCTTHIIKLTPTMTWLSERQEINYTTKIKSSVKGREREIFCVYGCMRVCVREMESFIHRISWWDKHTLGLGIEKIIKIQKKYVEAIIKSMRCFFRIVCGLVDRGTDVLDDLIGEMPDFFLKNWRNFHKFFKLLKDQKSN